MNILLWTLYIKKVRDVHELYFACMCQMYYDELEHSFLDKKFHLQHFQNGSKVEKDVGLKLRPVTRYFFQLERHWRMRT